jgi:septal ring factor EnvC (AmiA/AmiB activator)
MQMESFGNKSEQLMELVNWLREIDAQMNEAIRMQRWQELRRLDGLIVQVLVKVKGKETAELVKPQLAALAQTYGKITKDILSQMQKLEAKMETLTKNREGIEAYNAMPGDKA